MVVPEPFAPDVALELAPEIPVAFGSALSPAVFTGDGAAPEELFAASAFFFDLSSSSVLKISLVLCFSPPSHPVKVASVLCPSLSRP